MVNAQQEINQKYPNKNIDKIEIKRGTKLEGEINLRDYTELKSLSLIDCSLNNYNFLDTIPHKEKLTTLDLGHNSASNFQDLLWKISQFTNLEWVSLHGIKANNNEVKLKPLVYLPKCHTFAIDKNLTIGWEYTLDILQKAYCDEERNKQFLKWKQDHKGTRSWVKKTIDSEKEVEKLKKQNNDLNQKLTNQHSISKENQKEIIELEKSISKLEAEKEILENNLKEKDKEKQLAISEIKKTNEKHLSELSELVEEIGIELLDRKKKDLEQLLNEAKGKIDKSLWAYLDILLLVPDKNLISEKAKENIIDKIDGNKLQKLLLLQHQINHLEKRINEVSQQQAQIEVLPPSYN